MQLGSRIAHVLVTLAGIGALISLSAMFSAHFLLFDLISHFRVQYIVLLLPAFIMAMWIRKTLAVLVISVALAVHGYVVTMSLLPIAIRLDSEPVVLTVLNANLLVSNTNYQSQLDIIKTKQPDIIAFQEYTPAWDNALGAKLDLEYPYSTAQPLEGVFGIALYSKFPILSGGIDKFSSELPPVVNVNIQIDDRNVRVIAIHPPPPSTADMYEVRNNIMQQVALESKALDNPVIVMGDFNASPWTAHFSKMLSTGRLRSAQAGFGFHPTWPAGSVLLGIPIDHIVINSKVGVKHFESIRSTGSDHRTILSQLYIY